MIKEASTNLEIEKCFPVMKQLRPNIEEASFVETVRKLNEEGYVLVYLEENSEIKAVAGFKEQHNLVLGKHLYVEDLVTDEKARSKGHGQKLFKWLCDRGKQKQCSVIHLDSGTQRHAAHKFYLTQNMQIFCYHFIKELNP